ncbi:alpha/beta hydrolase [Pseudomonas sp. RIT-PI-S]|uniref:alpha/beta fold hydrolase n=1 Tax=Pseudomonas sp. RIT-PI-S TaxID=3035295 RepID=UPI0021D874FB|nr:alpha/beta hydrolase [Pseudomonas sp. RIT-PI-S]
MPATADQPGAIGAHFFHRTNFWETFHHKGVRLNEVNLHYVEGGEGPVVLLIPGWPQSWYAWRYVMPQLVSAGYRVVALDPRGMGESDAPDGAYDLTTVAAEVHAFARLAGLLDSGPIHVAGHDVGAWIAYALAADSPEAVSRLALFDAAIPGLSSPRTDLEHREANLRSWHFAFNQLDGLPEVLIAGREHAFITWLLRAKAVHPWTITAEDIDVYARQLAAPGAIRAAGRYYQSALSPEGVAANRRRSETQLAIPVMAWGAERGMGEHILKALEPLATQVEGGVIEGAGHYLPEEASERVAAELARFFAS